MARSPLPAVSWRESAYVFGTEPTTAQFGIGTLDAPC